MTTCFLFLIIGIIILMSNILGKRNEKGVIAPTLLLLVAVVGILGYLFFSSVLPFKNTLFTSLFPKNASFAAGIVDLEVVPNTVNIEKGKTFLVNIAIDAKTEQPTAMELGIKYNPQTLQLVTVARSSFFAKDLVAPQISSSSGTIALTYAQEVNAYKSGTGSVAALEFKALNTTTTASQITIDPASTHVAALNQTGDMVGTLTNSNVTITDPQAVTKTAEFSFSPAVGSVNVGSEIGVQIKVKNAVENANLFSAKINFDPNKLSVTRIDTTGSFVTQWVSTPTSFDNATGTISVVGGVPTPGFKGTATPSTMATVYFTGKASGSATVAYDGTSAIYRNSDNANILLSSAGGTYTVAAVVTPSPSPVVSPSPIPSPSVVPSASVAPSAAPSPSPVVSPSVVASASVLPSPVASPSPIATTCDISSATWVAGSNPILEKKLVNLNVTGTGACAGKTVAFNIFEDDGALGTDPVSNQPPSAKFDANNQATGSWLAEFQQDGYFGINNPPEYFFNVLVQGGTATVKSANPLLQVTALAAGQFIKGDSDRDGKVDLVDLSIMLSNWNKTQDLIDETDTNDDGVINTFDFAAMVQLLKLSGIVQ